MRCPKCEAANRDAAKFCVNCGASLVVACPQCGTELPALAKFCDACGAPVTVQPGEVSAEPPAPQSLPERLQRLIPKQYAERLLATRGQMEHERRLVTILLCDVKGSTALAEKLDPEEVMEIMDGAFDVLIEPVYRYEGTVARLMGDAVLAFFGAPIAHEDDPERACRAALDIIKGAKRYADELEQDRGIKGFDVRVGINTGLVVVGEMGSDLRVEYTAMGDAINLTARLESAAEPGMVLLSEATHNLVAPLFETEPLGPIQVKGRVEPVPVFQVLSAKEVPGKVRGIAGLESALVGREPELQALQEALERLEAGVGGIVTIVGDAGIGKSRLVAESRAAGAVRELPAWVEGRCLSYGTSIAYLLWLDILRGLLGVTAEDSPQTVRVALQERVQALCAQQFDDIYPYLGRLMSLPVEPAAEATVRDLQGEQLKAATFQAVETLMECAASYQPLVLVCEDLHWADPSSIELLDQMLGLTDRVGLLFICVFRPCRECGCWRLREVAARDYPHRHTDVWLQALSSADSEILVRNLLRIEGIPKPFRPKILSVAEGNPFYVEEILRGLIDQGAVIADQATGCWMVTAAAAEVELPSTLQAALVARIDRLQEDTRRVLQIASVIGRSFRYRVLEDIAREQRELDAHLLALQREEMIRERARIPELEYVFKHELTREAAYAGLLKKERRTLHRQVAQALERLFPERIERQLGLLAYHWEQADVPQKAAQYLQRAGDQARLAYANEEAIGYYQRALPVLEACAAEGLPAEWTLDVAGQVDEGLGDVLDWTGQYDRARSAYQDALAQAPSDRPIGRARLHRKTGDTCRRQRRYKEALQAYDLAQTELDTEPVEHTQEWWREWVQVRIERVWTHYWLAEWHEIGRLVEKLQPDVEQHGTPRQRCWFFSALALMAFRRDRYVVSEETLRHSQAAEAASQELGDLAMMTNAQFELGFAQLWLGDLDKAEQNLQASLTLAERTGDVMLEARCLTYLTVASRKRGQVEKTRHYIAKSLEVATAVQMREYIATAKANRAWVSWREENLAEAQENGRTALELWQQMPLVYPFRWTALWPLIGVALAENRTADAVEHARSLLEVTQQRLPDRLTGQLEEAISAWEGGEPQRAHACLNQCIEVAQEMGDL